MIAYPQPLASTCCCQVGPGGGTGGPPAPARPAPPRPNGNGPMKPNSIITGTGPLALAGVVRFNWISTVICGYEELSTWPTSFFTMIGTSPLVSCAVLVTSQFTLGVTLG